VQFLELRPAADVRVQHYDVHARSRRGVGDFHQPRVPDAVLGRRATRVAGVYVPVAKAGLTRMLTGPE
jgi:hypothetical protein